MPILDTSVCDMSPTSDYAAYLHTVYMFLINEASMIPARGLATIVKCCRASQEGLKYLEAQYFCLVATSLKFY